LTGTRVLKDEGFAQAVGLPEAFERDHDTVTEKQLRLLSVLLLPLFCGSHWSPFLATVVRACVTFVLV